MSHGEVAMIIREAKEQDYIAIGRISHDDLGYECSYELVSHRLRNLDKQREIVLVVVVDENVVGYVHAEIYNVLYFESMVNILGLAVSSQYRKQGIGKALIGEVENWAESVNIKFIRLNSGATRKDAHSFYKAVGFDDCKEQLRFIKCLK